MTARINAGGSMAREAIMAAMRSQAQVANQIASAQQQVGNPGGQGPGPTGVSGVQGLGAPGQVGQVAATSSSDFAATLREGLAEVTGNIRSSEQLPEKLVTGEVGEFHEVALQLKQSDLSFRFALQVRNKLIDAYREVMRMSV